MRARCVHSRHCARNLSSPVLTTVSYLIVTNIFLLNKHNQTKKNMASVVRQVSIVLNILEDIKQKNMASMVRESSIALSILEDIKQKTMGSVVR